MALRVVSGRKVVLTPGTAVALNVALRNVVSIWITALKSNTQPVCIGASNVRAAAGSENGIQLDPGQTVVIHGGMSGDGGLLDLSAIYVDAQIVGEGVTFFLLRQ